MTKQQPAPPERIWIDPQEAVTAVRCSECGAENGYHRTACLRHPKFAVPATGATTEHEEADTINEEPSLRDLAIEAAGFLDDVVALYHAEKMVSQKDKRQAEMLAFALRTCVKSLDVTSHQSYADGYTNGFRHGMQSRQPIPPTAPAPSGFEAAAKEIKDWLNNTGCLIVGMMKDEDVQAHIDEIIRSHCATHALAESESKREAEQFAIRGIQEGLRQRDAIARAKAIAECVEVVKGKGFEWTGNDEWVDAADEIAEALESLAKGEDGDAHALLDPHIETAILALQNQARWWFESIEEFNVNAALARARANEALSVVSEVLAPLLHAGESQP